MFEVEKTFRFEAGHTLMQHNGKCRFPHGHSYVLRVVLRSQTLVSRGPKQAMVEDFQAISDIVKPMIEEYLDHKWLNDTLKTKSPTAEFTAKWIFHFLKPRIPKLYKVYVSETESSMASYSEHNT